ncbi:Protein MAIN-LIKE 2 [Glycine max]|nr:Protein MAIN-LIKE 2 [Glycine max]
MIQMKLSIGEGSQHPHVGNEKLSLLLRMLLTWMAQLKRSSNSLKKPCDTSVLTAYADHVAIIVWNGKKFGRPIADIEGLVDATRLSLLITYPLDTGDQGLISTFMERRHKETSSFHFLVGEVTITLDDVASLLHLPIICVFHSFKTLYDDEAVLMVVEMKPKLRHYIVMGHMYNYLGYEIFIIANVRSDTGLLHFFFANKSATHVHVVFLDAFRDLNQSGSYAWGTAALVHMYDNLNDACKSSNKQLDGYITLLQCWIYEYFPSIAEVFTNEDYDERPPHDCRWTSTKASMKALSVSTYRKRLDRLTTADVCWIPYGDHRAVREFNLISCFYGHIQWGPVDQRGLCGSLGMFRRFLHTIQVKDYALKILTTDECISLTTLHWWAKLCCAWTMCTRLYGLVLHDFASIHEANTARGSTQTSTCRAR